MGGKAWINIVVGCEYSWSWEHALCLCIDSVYVCVYPDPCLQSGRQTFKNLRDLPVCGGPPHFPFGDVLLYHWAYDITQGGGRLTWLCHKVWGCNWFQNDLMRGTLHNQDAAIIIRPQHILMVVSIFSSISFSICALWGIWNLCSTFPWIYIHFAGYWQSSSSSKYSWSTLTSGHLAHCQMASLDPRKWGSFFIFFHGITEKNRKSSVNNNVHMYN